MKHVLKCSNAICKWPELSISIKSVLLYLLYNPFLVYCRELAPGIVSLTRDRAQGDDSKHDSHYNYWRNNKHI